MKPSHPLPPSTKPENRLSERLAHRLGRSIAGRPTLALGVGLVLALAGAVAMTGLEFDTSFAALLPEDTPEVREVNGLKETVGGTAELVIGVGGPPEARLVYARRLVERLRGRDYIRRADVELPVGFFRERLHWLIPLERLERLEEELNEAIDSAVARANPLFVDLEGDGARGKKPWQATDDLSGGTDDQRALLRSTLTSHDGRFLLIRVLPRGTASDMQAGAEVMARIGREIQAAGPAGLEVRLAGGLAVNQEQHQRMLGDLRTAGLLALVLIIALLTLYTRRLEAFLVFALPLVGGIVLALGVTALVIGRLNLVSGFLISALLGMGIDCEIHLYLRYLEELGAGRARGAAMRQAISATLPACFAAGITTALAFGAMTISEFRGFREYGAIAGIGIVSTLVLAYLLLPPLALALTRRVRPIDGTDSRRRLRPLARALALGFVAVAAVGFVLASRVAPEVRFHNDFERLRGESETGAFSAAVDRATGSSLTPAVVVVGSLDEARATERALADRVQREGSMVQRVLSLASLIPADTAEREPILARMRARVQRALKKYDMPAGDRQRLEAIGAHLGTPAWSAGEIPAPFRQQLTSEDGRSTFVLVWPRGSLREDERVIAWGTELNQIQAELRHLGIGATILNENRIAARVLIEMKRDAPRIVLLAAFAIFLYLLLDLRDLRRTLLVGGSLAVGVVWLLGVMHLLGIEFNVFNLAIAPSILGVGIDNAIHLQHRYRREGRGSVPLIIATTGRASLLATATTAIGFGTAIVAQHYGIRSMALLALAGLACTFTATTIFFPALLRLLEGVSLGRWWSRRTARSPRPAGGGEHRSDPAQLQEASGH